MLDSRFVRISPEPLTSCGIVRPDHSTWEATCAAKYAKAETFPDYESADHAGKRRSLSELLVDTLEEPIRYAEGKSIGIKR